MREKKAHQKTMKVNHGHEPAQQWFVIFCEESDGLPLMTGSACPTWETAKIGHKNRWVETQLKKTL